MFGPDWSQIQQTWLHRLGNLTLTGNNSTYKDKGPCREANRTEWVSA